VGITTGPDGNLWFTEDNADQIGMINPTTHASAEFPTPTASSGPLGITTGPDGNLWFTEFDANQIGMINPTTHASAEFPLPRANSDPEGITTGPDGNLWFTESGADQIGMINPTTHAIAEFPLPTAGSRPVEITTGPDGDVWFTETSIDGTSKIGQISPATHAIAEFPIDVPSYPSVVLAYDITAGPDGNLWFLEDSGLSGPSIMFGWSIGQINPTTHAIADYRIDDRFEIDGITSGPDGDLWFTEGIGKIGQFPLNAATPAPPQVVGSVGVSQSRKGTSYRVAFDQPLSMDTSNVDHYRVLGGVAKVVRRHKETVYTKALKIKGVAVAPTSNR
jgi:streptogramin lyase